jgi:hypothetical protein
MIGTRHSGRPDSVAADDAGRADSGPEGSRTAMNAATAGSLPGPSRSSALRCRSRSWRTTRTRRWSRSQPREVAVIGALLHVPNEADIVDAALRPAVIDSSSSGTLPPLCGAASRGMRVLGLGVALPVIAWCIAPMQDQDVAVGIAREGHVADAGIDGLAEKRHTVASRAARAAATSGTRSAIPALLATSGSPSSAGAQSDSVTLPASNSSGSWGLGCNPSTSR